MPHINADFESYVSVDVETAGPNPSQYSMLAIGACMVCDPQRTFYVELQPTSDNVLPSALSICGLSMEELAENGLTPAEAMARFEIWAKEQVPEVHRPLFVAFNAPFDWMFVNDYFHRYIGANPFGHSAIDIKAFYMGLTGVSWEETAMRHVADRYLDRQDLTHNALQDAQDQAALFRHMLAELEQKQSLSSGIRSGTEAKTPLGAQAGRSREGKAIDRG